MRKKEQIRQYRLYLSQEMDEGRCVFTAARRGDRDLLRTLLLHRSVEERSDRGLTPLHEAARAGETGCVREVLSMAAASGVFIEYVNTRATNGQTAVFMAAAEGHTDIVKLLATAGANINVKDASGLTPLLAAVSNDKPATAMALIRKGRAVHVTDVSGQSCLHLASAQGSSELVSMLLRFGALNLRNVEHKTALYLAAEHGHHECLEMLAAAGANVEIQATDGGTPLLVATEAQSEPCVDALLKHGADPNVECREYWPPLAIHAAAVGENVNILRRLAAVTRRGLGSGEGEVSPVFFVLENPEMLEVLLKEGFSPEPQAGWENEEYEYDYDADSPLGLVLYHMVNDPALNHSRCMSLLMRAGAPLTEDCWRLSLSDPCVLDLLLAQRCEDQGKGPGARPLLSGEELEALVSVAEEDATEAGSWLPALLESGLDPNALLVPAFLEEAPSEALTYLLEMVDRSTLGRLLRDVLEQRQKMKTWTPPAHLEWVPPLFHLCRLRLRAHLGPDVLMRSPAVSQLPVPLLLHDHLLFADIKAPGNPHSGYSPSD
ncbi:ankyrin repeat and SOCS box protein 3-like isoform X1 [Gadus macrocephalus]|uniref:ankyrin repeat and SOCS box protein 3-like isoform X1 n=1 Tax=Gadus macrocephalus TaxID=80720 RepID=UPI0028CB24AA|nr:ankyrin repeat and SOCS box protein 3-like isoform X1 [Gadus macrocephalus]